MNFDDYFIVRMDGSIAMSMLDFYFKPSGALGLANLPSKYCASSEYGSFREFIRKQSKSRFSLEKNDLIQLRNSSIFT